MTETSMYRNGVLRISENPFPPFFHIKLTHSWKFPCANHGIRTGPGHPRHLEPLRISAPVSIKARADPQHRYVISPISACETERTWKRAQRRCPPSSHGHCKSRSKRLSVSQQMFHICGNWSTCGHSFWSIDCCLCDLWELIEGRGSWRSS